MGDLRSDLRAALGPVGAWSFALQANGAEAARRALREWEALGYRSTWVPESVGSKEAFAHAAVLLAGSDRMVVGTGIANIYARDPMAMANGARTLTEAFPGRFVLGVGVSHAPSVAARGGTYERPIEHMTAYLDAMEAATWSGPELARRTGILLAALGPRMLDLAGARADGAHTYFVPVEHTAMARARLGAGPLLVVEQTAVLDTDPGRSMATARAFAARYLGAENYANNLRRLGWGDVDLAGGGSDRLIDAVLVRGDARAIADRVRDHLAAGADHVCVQLRRPDPADLAPADHAELAAAIGDLMQSASPDPAT